MDIEEKTTLDTTKAESVGSVEESIEKPVKATSSTREMKPHWYMIYHHDCPICGEHHKVRERQYTPKPTDPLDRMRFIIEACVSHFV